MSENKKSDDEKREVKKFVARTPVEVQRAKLSKLMEKPDKEINIPQLYKKPSDISSTAPSFVRNVMGSSAGAGSGEFHVYRHLRRKEYARQKQIEQKSRQEELDDEFVRKIEENRLKADEKTAKKRAKRMKKKLRTKKKKVASNTGQKQSGESQSSSDEDDNNHTDEKSGNESTENTQQDVTEAEHSKDGVDENGDKWIKVDFNLKFIL